MHTPRTLPRVDVPRSEDDDLEAKYRVYFEEAMDATLVADDERRFVDVNRAACELLGLSRAELLGRRIDDIMPSANVDAIWRSFLAEGHMEGDVPILRADGVERVVEFRARANVAPGRHVSALRDVTRQRTADERLQILLESTQLLAESLDPKTTLANVAKLLVPRVADWCAVDLVDERDGVPKAVVIEHVDPKKVEFGWELRRRFPIRLDDPAGVMKVIRTGTPELYPEITDELLSAGNPDPELLRILRDVGMRSALVVPLRAHGRNIGAMTIVSTRPGRIYEQTDLRLAEKLASRAALAIDNAVLYERTRQAEERLLIALDAGRMGAWEWDIASAKITWSQTLERLRRMPEGSFDGTFASYERLIHPDDRERVLAAIRGAVEQRSPYHVVYRGLRGDGSYGWIETSGRVLVDERDEATRMIGVSFDVTERIAAEKERAELLKTAELAARAREDLLAIVSHDLRNPLGVITFATSLLLENRRWDDGARLQAEKALRAAQQMDALIHDLLDASRLEAGRLQVTLEPHPVRSLVTEAVESVQLLATKKGVKLEHHVDAASAPVLCDRARILQVFANLVGNAIKFTPEGGRIVVRGGVDGAHAVFTVTDTGPGIPKELLPHLFDRYWQANRTRRAGAGLGLYIAKGIVDVHKGTVHVESELGKGTTFTFTIPLA